MMSLCLVLNVALKSRRSSGMSRSSGGLVSSTANFGEASPSTTIPSLSAAAGHKQTNYTNTVVIFIDQRYVKANEVLAHC